MKIEMRTSSFKKGIDVELLKDKLGISTDNADKFMICIKGALICFAAGIFISWFIILGFLFALGTVVFYGRKSFKDENAWRHVLKYYDVHNYEESRIFMCRLSDEEKKGSAYKKFNNLMLRDENKFKIKEIEYSNEILSDFLVVNIETTGSDYIFDRVVKINADKYKNGMLSGSFEKTLDYENDDKAWKSFFDFTEDLPIVTYNAEFLYGFCDELSRKTVDTLKMSKRCYPDLEDYGLKSVAERMKLPLSKKCTLLIADIYFKFCHEREVKDAEFNGMEKNIFGKVKRILIKNNRSVDYLRMKHTGVYVDFCIFYTMLRVKCNGKKQYVLTDMDREELLSLGLLVEAPSKSEKSDNRVMLESVKDFSVFEEYIVKMYDQCMASLDLYVNSTNDGRRKLEKYLAEY